MTQALLPLADTAEFDVSIALDLAASHWRTAALFLSLTAKYAEAGDYLSLDGIAVERANNSSKGTWFTNSSKKHGPPPRHGSGPRRFEISSQLIADAEQPETRA